MQYGTRESLKTKGVQTNYTEVEADIFFLINQEKKSYQTTPKQGALPKYTGSIQRRPHPRQQRRNKNLEKPKITNKSTTQHIHKREIVHVHELLRPFKKSPKEEILQARIWLLFFLEHYSIPLSPIHQNKQIDAIFQTTLLFFSRPLIFHSRSKFLTEFGNTHTTPKEESTKRSWGRHGKPIKVRQLYLFFCKDQKHKSIYWGLMELKSHMEVRKLKQSHLEMTQTIIS